MNKRNYQKELEEIIRETKNMPAVKLYGYKPKLLLHSCCAPCSSYCLEYLRKHFQITVFYYNPNITLEEEYRKRVEEEKRLIAELNSQVDAFMDYKLGAIGSGIWEPGYVMEFPGDMRVDEEAGKILMLEGNYEPDKFLTAVKGFEEVPEGGERCTRCFRLRLFETARVAAERNFDYFTTTLTISPLKDAERLNSIGEEACAAIRQELNADLAYLPSDFKKKEGYKRSISLSQTFSLYRQDYCGCGFSKMEALKRKEGQKD